MKSPSELPPKRPRLTRKVIEALRGVYADAEVMLDERAGTDSAFNSDKLTYHGLEYLDALFTWYDATHPETQPKKPVPHEHTSHNPDCVFSDGHEGECLSQQEITRIDPATGEPWLTPTPPKWPPPKVRKA
jgi:hypothetical protein